VFFSQGSTRISGSAGGNDQWNLYTLVRVGTTITLYVNGTSVGTSTTTSFPTGDLSVSVGSNTAHTSPSNSFDGFIDEVLVATRALYSANFTPPSSAFFPP
jgi:hypothetical protein